MTVNGNTVLKDII